MLLDSYYIKQINLEEESCNIFS